jgi:hypothetical protein
MQWGFSITLLLLIIAYFTKTQWQPFVKKWLLSIYIIAVIFCLFQLGFVTATYISFFRASDSEGYDVYRKMYYAKFFYPFLFLSILVLTLFMFRRVRNSFGLSLAILPVIHYQTIYNIESMFDKIKWPVDYGGSPKMPSYGVFYYIKYFLYFLLFNGAALGVYVLLRRLNKKVHTAH